MEINFVQDALFIYILKQFKLINYIKYRSIKLNKEIKEKINLLLNSDAINYLETSERLILKNVLDKKMISDIDSENLDKILEKYKKSIKK